MIINAFTSWIIQPLKEEASFDSQLLKYLFQCKHRPDFFASSTQYSALVILRGQFKRSSNTIPKGRVTKARATLSTSCHMKSV